MGGRPSWRRRRSTHRPRRLILWCDPAPTLPAWFAPFSPRRLLRVSVRRDVCRCAGPTHIGCSTGCEVSVAMLPTATCRVVVVVLVLAGMLAGCMRDGDDADQERFGPDRTTTSGVFRQLRQRPLDLPTVDLRGRGIRERPAGDCVEDGGVPVVAIATRAFFGVGALAPHPHWQRGPVYALVGDAPPPGGALPAPEGGTVVRGVDDLV